MRVSIIGNGNLGKALFNKFKQNTKLVNINDLSSDILFLCVKPKDVSNVLKDIKENKIIVSCAAGITLDYLKTNLPQSSSVIRCMTNIPVSTMIYTFNNSLYQDSMMDQLFQDTDIYKTTNEKEIDLATVMIGCMPAYLSFIFQEFIKFGEEKGLENSRKMFASTVIGTLDSEYSEMIKAVCSPGGVTQKGIDYMKQEKMLDILEKTMESSLAPLVKD